MPEEAIVLGPLELKVQRICEPPFVFWDLNLCFLEEQPVFLPPEPSFQPSLAHF